jgi:hypothetical protein
MTQYTRTITRQVVGASASLPAWLSGVPLNTWTPVPNSKLQEFVHPDGVPCAASLIYSGMHIKTGTSIFAFRGGGHFGGSDNSVVGIDLAADVPRFFDISEPSPLVERLNTHPATLWWGTPPNQKPNTAHTYDSALFSAALNSHIWFGLSSPHAEGASQAGSHYIFSLNAATGKWVQPGSQIALPDQNCGKACAQDTAGNMYIIGVDMIYKYTLGVGWSQLVRNPALAHDGFSQLVYDSLRNRLIRIGDSATATKWWTIDCVTGELNNVSSQLNGDSTVLANLDAAVVYTLMIGATYDPLNDRYSMSRGTGGGYFNINPTTWAVTYTEPPTTSGVVAPAHYGEVDGRFKYVPALRGILLAPNSGWPNFPSMWFIRTA